MTKSFIFCLLLACLMGCGCPSANDLECIVDNAEEQFEYALSRIKTQQTESKIFPRTVENDHLRLVASSDWTSGFFPGNLWMMYELTKDPKWKEQATIFTSRLEKEQWNGNDHDIGFKMFCSYGHAIKYSDNQKYRDILVQSAKTLATRYNPVVGCIRSWNKNPKTAHWEYPVIIDNMMNLELLMWASKETGNESFRDIAISHARRTLHNHFRSDYSCYHVVDYDPQTGEVRAKNTHQGAADDSDWARGQAWALYGFTMMYRETGLDEFLDQANHIAAYLLKQKGLKDGHIPYWDFKAPNIPNEPYDASAAAIIASALYELYGFSKNEAYLSMANHLMSTLASPEFFSNVGTNEGFLLMHSTGSKPYNSEIDVPLVYADYYFLEALIRSKKWSGHSS